MAWTWDSALAAFAGEGDAQKLVTIAQVAAEAGGEGGSGGSGQEWIAATVAEPSVAPPPTAESNPYDVWWSFTYTVTLPATSLYVAPTTSTRAYVVAANLDWTGLDNPSGDFHKFIHAPHEILDTVLFGQGTSTTSLQTFTAASDMVGGVRQLLGDTQENLHSLADGVDEDESGFQGQSAAATKTQLTSYADTVAGVWLDLQTAPDLQQVVNQAREALVTALSALVDTYQSWQGLGSGRSDFYGSDSGRKGTPDSALSPEEQKAEAGKSLAWPANALMAAMREAMEGAHLEGQGSWLQAPKLTTAFGDPQTEAFWTALKQRAKALWAENARNVLDTGAANALAQLDAAYNEAAAHIPASVTGSTNPDSPTPTPGSTTPPGGSTSPGDSTDTGPGGDGALPGDESGLPGDGSTAGPATGDGGASAPTIDDILNGGFGDDGAGGTSLPEGSGDGTTPEGGGALAPGGISTGPVTSGGSGGGLDGLPPYTGGSGAQSGPGGNTLDEILDADGNPVRDADGNPVLVPPGSVINADRTVTTPGGGTVKTSNGQDLVVPEGSGFAPAMSVVDAEGNPVNDSEGHPVVVPEGSEINEDGTITGPNGELVGDSSGNTVHVPDGSQLVPAQDTSTNPGTETGHDDGDYESASGNIWDDYPDWNTSTGTSSAGHDFSPPTGTGIRTSGADLDFGGATGGGASLAAPHGLDSAGNAVEATGGLGENARYSGFENMPSENTPLPESGAQSAASGAAGGYGGMPMSPMSGMGGMGGGAGAGQGKERSRTTWLDEDEDVWGAYEESVPGVIGATTPALWDEEEELTADAFQIPGTGRRGDVAVASATGTPGRGPARAGEADRHGHVEESSADGDGGSPGRRP